MTEPTPSGPAVLSARTILIVEDNLDIRQTLQDALEFEGYSVETCENGRDGLARLGEIARPGLIILDYRMPVLDGPGVFAGIERGSAVMRDSDAHAIRARRRQEHRRRDGVLAEADQLGSPAESGRGFRPAGRVLNALAEHLQAEL